MVSKRDLGLGYILGVGLGLIASLAGYYLVLSGPVLDVFVGAATAMALATVLLYVGYWLYVGDLGDEEVWSIAQWSAVGLSLPVLLAIVLTVFRVGTPVTYIVPSLLVNVVAAGAVIGLLLGTVRGLRSAHLEVKQLNRRNTVLNRVLRHNLRNDMSVIMGNVDRLEFDVESEDVAREVYDAIRGKIDEITELSSAARNIERIGDDDEEGPLDVVPLVEDRLAVLEGTSPDVQFETELPPSAPADVGSLFGSAFDNLVRNAIVHNDKEAPWVRIVVRRVSGDAPHIEVSVRDNGPGIPDHELQALSRELEESLEHGSGLGLWLVKWVVDSYGGDLEFGTAGGTGTDVTMRFPAAT